MRDNDDPPREEHMNKYTKRRKRRRANSVVKNGKASVRKHAKIAGRTGRVQSRRVPGKRVAYRSTRPNPPGPESMNLGNH